MTEHGNTDVIHCGPGDVVAIKGPGAGGYGLAKHRRVQAVLQDVQCGFLTEQAAREQYGVALQCGEIDEVGTARLRAAMPEGNGEHFDVGEARRTFEAVWTPERYQLLTAFLAQQPVVWRHFLKHQVFAAVKAGEGNELTLDEQMSQLFAELKLRFPALGAV
ncbi:hypothetical protein ERHA55_21080 [Erwinia rhapontici]|nr:hypothetical protein ERHA55_21080 [Erwinia rhapontici]